MLKESRDVHHHKGLQEPIRMGRLMGTEMVMLAVMGMEKTVQMAMKMVTINEDLLSPSGWFIHVTPTLFMKI